MKTGGDRREEQEKGDKGWVRGKGKTMGGEGGWRKRKL